MHQEANLPAGVGGNFAAVTLDVSDRAAIKKLWDQVPADLRNVDVLGEYSCTNTLSRPSCIKPVVGVIIPAYGLEFTYASQ